MENSQEKPLLFHGMTEKQFEKHYSDNYQIPELWTTGPIQAYSYALVYKMDNRGGILIWTIVGWSENNFRKTSEGVDKQLPGLGDTPIPDWYRCVLNPFTSREDRDSKVKLYPEKDLEEYVELYVKDKSAKKQLLQLARLG